MTRTSVGRYRDRASALQPGELPREGLVQNGRGRIKHGAVDDPNPAFRGKRQRVAINACTDVLEHEYSRGRISEAGYLAARSYQLVLEKSAGKPSGGGQWVEGDRVDAAAAHEVAIVRSLDSARAATDMVFNALPVVGLLGAKVMRMALVERLTIVQIADELDGRSERMQVIFYAETFRRACEALADHWAGRGVR